METVSHQPQRVVEEQRVPRGSRSSGRSVVSSLSTQTLLQIVLFAGIFVLNFFEETDPDLWWHLATGRYIVQTGSIPTTDIFSYTAAGRPWMAHEWLAEIVMFLLYRTWGYAAAVVVFAALITLAYWVVFRTLRLLEAGVVVSAVITFWMAAMAVTSWNVRPQIFSYLFFAVYLYLLLRSRRTPGRAIWLMPAIMVVWVNLHAGYIMGLLLQGLFIVGEVANWVSKRRRDGERTQNPELRTQNLEFARQNPPLQRYLLVAAATLAATVANPRGPSILLYPLEYSGTQNASMRFIAEWQSPNFHNYFFFIFGAAILLLMAVRGRAPQDWAIAVPVLVLTAMTFESVRVIAFFSIAAAPYIASRLTRGRDQGSGTTKSVPRPPTPAPRLLNWLLLAVCLGAMALPLFISDRAQVRSEPRTVSFPVEGVNYLKQAGITGNLFNTYQWGGYLAWIYYPDRRVFVDGRADMYGDQFIQKYMTVNGAGSGWSQILDEYGVQAALIEKDGPLATLLAASGKWKEVFQGPVESVFVKSTR